MPHLSPSSRVFAIMTMVGWIAAITSIPVRAAPSEQANVDALQEILVTAQRREASLQDTPIAVSVVSGDEIQQLHLSSLGDIAERVPNITFDSHSANETYISIRGSPVGNDAAGIDQGVTVFIDDVPTTGFGDDDPELYDLESVEVLRGPQGTLFGRNVMGGAVLIHTLAPSFQPAGRATITYGSDNLMESQALLTGPLIDGVLAGKVAFDLRRRDNYVNNIDNPWLKTGGQSLGSLRFQVHWSVSDKLKILFGADYLNDNSQDFVRYTIRNIQPSLTPPLSNGPDATSEGSTSVLEKKIGGGLIRAEYSLEAGELASITGYRTVDDHTKWSSTNDPRDTFLSEPATIDRSISEELRFSSSTAGRLTYIAGLFFLHADRSYFLPHVFNLTPGTFFQVLTTQFANPVVNTTDQHVALDSTALYGEANYNLTPELKLTLGGRYSSERKSGHTEVLYSAGPTASFGSGPYAKTWGAFTPKIMLAFEPTKDFLTYASATKGFEAGGFDANGSNAAELASGYAPEYVWSYELGVKSTLFSRRLQIDAALFDAEYTNLQTRNFDPVTALQVAGNAGKARARGVELEISALPTEWLTLAVTYAYDQALYTHYANVPSPNDGHSIPYSPKNAVNARVDTHFASPTGSGTVFLGGDITFRSKITFDDAADTNPAVTDQSAQRGILNLHARWQAANDKFEFELWAKNATDRRYVLQSFDFSRFLLTPAEFASGGDVSVVNYNLSRILGASFTTRF